VIDNLLSNAVKFTAAGGTIVVRVRHDGDQVVLEVSDTGIGIEPKEVDRVFERFYQVDGSSRRRYGGVGLGLALVKELVELHGGQVSVESEVGKGSVFTVVLPTLSVREEARKGVEASC
jgi:signal transduction histidine kinase